MSMYGVSLSNFQTSVRAISEKNMSASFKMLKFASNWDCFAKRGG